MVKGKLFEQARQATLVKTCDGCHETKPISSFKKGNKYCSGCGYVDEIRERYKTTQINPIQEIEDIDLDEFFKD